MSKVQRVLNARHNLTPFGVLLVFLAGLVVRGWSMMIVLGMLAGYAAIPGLAVGFFPALAMAILIRLMLWISSDNKTQEV